MPKMIQESYNFEKVAGGNSSDITVYAVQNGLRSNTIGVPLTDLTGTTWLLKKPSEMSWPDDTMQKALTHKFTFGEYESDTADGIIVRRYSTYYCIIGQTNTYPFFAGVLYPDATGDSCWQYGESSDGNNVVLGDVRVIIEIIGGDDADDADLIAWIEANGEQQIYIPTVNEYALSALLTNLSSDVELKFEALDGFELPENITVTGGTLVSWDSETGVAVISGYSSETEVTVICSKKNNSSSGGGGS